MDMKIPSSTPWRDLRHRVKNSAIRNRVRASPAYVRTKVFLKRIAGKELWLRPEVRPAMFRHGEWALCSAPLLGKRLNVYSFGIGDTIDFERALGEAFPAEVHAFDPTPSVAPWLGDTETPRDFRFHPWALAGRDETLVLYPRVRGSGITTDDMYTIVPEAGSVTNGIEVQAKRLSTIMGELGHASIDVLKMDIEGAEYGTLADVLRSEIYPTQILVEFHHRFASIGKEKTREVIRRLRVAGYQVAFVSMVGREVTFVQKAALDRPAAGQG